MKLGNLVPVNKIFLNLFGNVPVKCEANFVFATMASEVHGQTEKHGHLIENTMLL